MMLACCRSLLLGDDSAVAHKMRRDRKSTRLNSSHSQISYAVFCLKKKKKKSARIEAYPQTSMPCPTSSASPATARSPILSYDYSCPTICTCAHFTVITTAP